MPSKKSTRLIHGARPEKRKKSLVNPPVARGSTILFDDPKNVYAKTVGKTYGRLGHETHELLEEALKELEGGDFCYLTPNGLSACSLAMLASAKAGDHVLITDSAYGPTRRFAEETLPRYGITSEFFEPADDNIEALFRENTSLIYLETPGSLTLEIQDIKAIAEAAKAQGVTVIVDNTWAASIALNPITLGADIVVQALTKYVMGHSDGFGGAVITKGVSHKQKVYELGRNMGLALAPEEAYSALRGLRTLSTRYAESGASALKLAKWMQKCEEVKSVWHPALNSHPQHDLWKRDFEGSGGLFSVIMQPEFEPKVGDFLSALKFFGLGFSYGGFESLCIHCDPQLERHFTPDLGGPLIRFYCGLEDADDLIADVEQALDAVI